MPRTRINIQAFKPATSVDTSYADGLWDVLSTAFKQIYSKNASNLSFEELYRNAYNMVLYKHGDRLYGGVKSVIEARLRSESVAVIESPDDEAFMSELRRKWTDHTMFMTMFRDILMYMDRTYVPAQELLPVYDLGLKLFYETVVKHDRVGPRLRRILLLRVEQERKGEVCDRAAFREMTAMLMELGVNKRTVYEDLFEKPFRAESSTFYRAEANQLIATNTCAAYLRKAAARLEEEMARVETCMDMGSLDLVRSVVETEMIERHMSALLQMTNSGLRWMIDNDAVQDLQHMYTLFHRVRDGLVSIRDLLCRYVEEDGMRFVNDDEMQKHPDKFVAGLLDMKAKHDTFLVKSFRNDRLIGESLRQTFVRFINKNKHSAEYLTLFLDDLLKTGGKGLTDEELESKFDQTLVLFNYLEDKDVFERFYKTYLARRLLNGRSGSDDAERVMITKLKQHCSFSFTNKLEGMFNDIKASEETMASFKVFLESQRLDVIDLNVKVLTTGNWPSSDSTVCTFPKVVADAVEAFKKFYLQRHSGRKISWQANMGSAEMRAFLGARRKKCDLSVTTYQMIILLLFNDTDELTYRDLKLMTNIPENELRRHALSMCTPKVPLLTCDLENGARMTDANKFAFNREFTPKLFRIRVPLLREERDLAAPAVPDDVQNDRKMIIDAAVVRIMKSRKRMENNLLIAEVSQQLMTRFKPEPIMIKKRIENLIEREYLERDDSDSRYFLYVA